MSHTVPRRSMHNCSWTKKIISFFSLQGLKILNQIILLQCLQGFAWVEVAGKKDRLQGWLQGSMVPLQFASGPGPDCIDAIGILTEGDAIVIRSPLGSGLAGVSGEQSLPSPVARFQSPYKEQELSTFAVVLDSIEQAIETAAVAVETMAGGVSSPEDLRTAPGKSDE